MNGLCQKINEKKRAVRRQEKTKGKERKREEIGEGVNYRRCNQ